MTNTLCRFGGGLQLQLKQMSWVIAIGAMFFFFGLDEARAERRCVTVTTGARAVVYLARAYTCAKADGSDRETHAVDLGPAGWTIPANTTTDPRYFDVPCTAGKHVIAVSALYLWVGEDCTDGLNRLRLPLGKRLGRVTTRLLCGGEVPGRGACSDLFSCGLDDGDLTSVCFTQPDPDDCTCSDAFPPQEGVDYGIAGDEIDFFAPEVIVTPAVTEWGMMVLTLMLLTGLTIKLGRRRPTGA